MNKENPKILIAVPMLKKLDSEFFTSFVAMKHVGQVQLGVEIDSLVYEARNRLVINALNNGCDYMLWLDSDMTFEPDIMVRLYEDLQQEGVDFVSGLCFKRALPTKPTIIKKLVWNEKEDGTVEHWADSYEDYPKDSLFEIAGCGFAAVMCRTKYILDVADHFGMSPFSPVPYLGEDFSFCIRAKAMGKKMFCDSRVKLGHIGTMIYDEAVWMNQENRA